MVARMTSGGFLSTEALVVVLARIAPLAILGAPTLAPPDRRLGRRRQVVAFLGCLAGTWAVALFGIALIGAAYDDPLKQQPAKSASSRRA